MKRPAPITILMANDLRLIWIAYLTIPLILLVFTRRRKDLPFPWMFWMFALFILSCGFSHFFEVYSIFWPRLWLVAGVKLFTAVVSFATIVALFPTLKLAIQLHGPTELEALVRERTAELSEVNASLQVEIAEHQATQAALRTANDGLETRVRERTGELVRANETLSKEIGERTHVERELRQSEERFRALLEFAPDAIVIASADGRITLVNSQTETMFGYEREELLGQFVEVLIPERFRSSHVGHRTSYSANPRTRPMGVGLDLSARRKDGSEFPVEISLSPLKDQDELLITSVIRDITARRQAEELSEFAARLQRSNRELLEFASVASHDLQEPLRKIQAFADRLQTRFADALGEQGRNDLARMHSAATQMRRRIDDLLNFSRVTIKATPFTPVDLGQVAREVVSDLEDQIQQTGARVDLGELPIIDADPTQMRQLLRNLIGNALKFHRADAPPVVAVRAELSPIPASRTATCQIIVRDNGIGFDEKYLDRIFMVFERLHGRNDYEGTGMGLAICRKIVEWHGGTITARSTPGQGATFIVSMPVRHTTAQKGT